MIFLLFPLLPLLYAQICPGVLTDAERNGFLAVHNNLRSEIAKGIYTAKGVTKPSAANMLAMNWDCYIESTAQRYANTCPTDHSNWPGFGENLYWSWSTQPISPVGIGARSSNSWATEFQTYGWNSTNYEGQPGIGHATQMAWASSGRIGCGYAQCPSTNPSFQYQIAVVCQYAQPGNMLSAPIYTAGPKCSKCPTGSTCTNSTGLCQAGAASPPAATPATPAPPPTTTSTPKPTTTTPSDEEYYWYYYE